MPVEMRAATQGRLRSVDALRGVAALGVVLYHAAGAIVLPAVPAFYYARVLEDPSCRWHWRICVDAAPDCATIC